MSPSTSLSPSGPSTSTTIITHAWVQRSIAVGDVMCVLQPIPRRQQFFSRLVTPRPCLPRLAQLTSSTKKTSTIIFQKKIFFQLLIFSQVSAPQGPPCGGHISAIWLPRQKACPDDGRVTSLIESIRRVNTINMFVEKSISKIFRRKRLHKKVTRRKNAI